MNQPDLFEVGERDVHGTLPGSQRTVDGHSTCTAAPVGSGPKDQTCKTCRHKARQVRYNGKVFLKCALMAKYWSHGKATDIKACWPACREWQTAEGTTEKRTLHDGFTMIYRVD